MSGGSSQSQPEGEKKPCSHVQLTCLLTFPSPKCQRAHPSPVAGLVLQHLALNHQWSCWGSMKVDKKGLQTMFSEQCCSVLWCSTSPQQMPPQHGWIAAAPISHACTSQQAAEQSDTPRLDRFVISYIWRVRKTTNKHCVMIPSGKL